MPSVAPPAEYSAFHASVLSVVAGYADTLGYLSFGAFAGLMTGNTVLLGIAVASGQMLHALHNFLIIVAFLSGVASSLVLRRVGVGLPWLLPFEAAALAAAAFLPAVPAAVVLAFGMGLQNAAATRFAGATLNTVFLTGDLQKLVGALVGRFGTARAGPADPVGVLAAVYACYLLGALLGATAYEFLPRPLLWAILLLPLALLRPASPAKPR